jgi:protoporphyrinogen oxidase
VETFVERYYHHLFRSDSVAQRWIAEVGLGGALEYLPATMGFFTRGRMHRFGTALSLASFTPLPLADRLRLGRRIQRLSAIDSPAGFDSVTAEDWLRRRASDKEMDVFWRPLLDAKFSEDRGLVSMAWLWARFRARVGGSLGGRERLGYVRGGFQRFNNALAAHATSRGVELRLGCGLGEIAVAGGRVRSVTTSAGDTIRADILVWTPSLAELVRRVPTVSPSFRAACARTRYHAAIVVVVELSQSVLPYYWVTVVDPKLPFTVAVEHTRLVGTADYGGRVIVYLGRYVSPENPMLDLDDEAIRAQFLQAAAGAFHPGFASPLAAHVFRAPSAQPIIRPGWAAQRPPAETGVTGVLAANMAQIYPWDRGINYSLELGEQVAARILAEPLPTARAA